jgi:hypothetical protein
MARQIRFLNGDPLSKWRPNWVGSLSMTVNNDDDLLLKLVRGAGFEPAETKNDGDGEECEVFDLWKLRQIRD